MIIEGLKVFIFTIISILGMAWDIGVELVTSIFSR